MKKWLSIVLCAALLAACLPASAQKALRLSDETVLYIEETGEVYTDAGEKRTTFAAQEILWAEEGLTVYLNRTETGLRLVRETMGRRLNVYAGAVSLAACTPATGLVYYTRPDDACVLYRCSPRYGVSLRACAMPAPIVQLVPSAQGLIILCLDEMGNASSYCLPVGSTAPVESDVAQEYAFEGCSVQVLLEGGMRVLFEGMPDAQQTLADTPLSLCMSGPELFYLKSAAWGAGVQLHRYRTDEMQRSLLTVINTPVHSAIASDGLCVYLVSAAGRLLAYDAQTGKQALSAALPSVPVDPELILLDDTLYLYDTLEDGTTALLGAYDVAHSQTGVELAKRPTAALTPSPAPSPTPTPVPTPTPAPTPTPTPVPIELKRGMRGEDVRLMQEALIELGYLDDRADGSFGSRTLRAVRLFQEAVGFPETGVADNALLALLYADNAPQFDLYAPLCQGDEGLRVRDLQNALYEKGYIAQPADGSFGPNTAAAVKRLQAQLGLRQTGVMSSTNMEYVYNGNMPFCVTYFMLRMGDSGPRVEQLQSRLAELGYYTGPISGSYDAETYRAVCLFEAVLGASQTGKAGTNMQTLLYSASAPVYPGELPTPSPTPAPTPAPTPDPNVIGPGSPYEQVLDLQQKLCALGKIGPADVTGAYNSATKYAIGYIQIEMRDVHGYSGVKSTGRADAQTKAFIDQLYADLPPAPPVTPAPVTPVPVTPTPATPAPVTPAPAGDTINANSPREVIFAAQQKLFATGYMTDPICVSGVYDKETKNSVYYLQRDLNQYFGQNLEKSGHIDPVTGRFLDELYAQKSEAQRASAPVVMGDTVKALCDMLNAFEAELSPHYEVKKPATAVKWAQVTMQKWGYYPAEYKPDSAYDRQMFDLVAALRADLAPADPALAAVDPALAGVIDAPLFAYFKQMHLTDPAAVPAGSPLVFKVWD